MLKSTKKCWKIPTSKWKSSFEATHIEIDTRKSKEVDIYKMDLWKQ